MDNFLSSPENMKKSWTFKEKGFSIFQYVNTPIEGTTTYVTVGLSQHELEQDSEQNLRQELMLTVLSEFDNLHPEVQLAVLSEELLERHFAIPNGQVINCGDELFKGLPFSAFYCTSAKLFSEEFEIIEHWKPQLIFIWLIPITSDEAFYCKSHGHSAFEEVLKKEEPDLLNLNRKGINVPCKLTKPSCGNGGVSTKNI
jgi:hypothetical protein